MDRAGGLVVGIDWGTETHSVCVLGAEGESVLEVTVKNEAKGIASLQERLRELEARHGASVRIGIESPSVAVARVLVKEGFHVFSINPKQSDRFRDRHSAAGAKDDRRDAWVIAQGLRTDPGCYRAVRPPSPFVVRLQQVTSSRKEVVDDLVCVASRLRNVMLDFVPDFVHVANDFQRDWVLSICERIVKKGATRVTGAAIGKILKKGRVKKPFDEVFAAIKADIGLSSNDLEAYRERCGHLVARIRLLKRQERECDKALDKLLHEAPEGSDERRQIDTLLSFPGTGPVVAATLMSRAPWAIAEGCYEALRQLSGVAPVTLASGKKKRVVQRRSCDEELRNALFLCAKAAVRSNVVFKNYAKKLAAEGKPFGQRMRVIGDKLLAAQCAALRAGRLFDETRLNGLTRSIAAAAGGTVVMGGVASTAQGAVANAEAAASSTDTTMTAAAAPAESAVANAEAITVPVVGTVAAYAGADAVGPSEVPAEDAVGADPEVAAPVLTAPRRVHPEDVKRIRNEVPVQEVLGELRPHTPPIGARLACPACGAYHAKVKRETNLLRCFGCKQNWNPIDLLVTYGGLSFPAAVERLRRRLAGAAYTVVGTPPSTPPGTAGGARSAPERVP